MARSLGELLMVLVCVAALAAFWWDTPVLEPCPGVRRCEADFGSGERRPEAWGNLPFYVRCMRHETALFLWAERPVWDQCAVRAALQMSRTLVELVKNGEPTYPPELDGDLRWNFNVVEHGGVYVALLLGEQLQRCEREAPGTCHGITWADLEEIFALAAPIDRLWQQYRAGRLANYESFKYLAVMNITDLSVSPSSNCDVLTVGPYGFNNEPVFTPGLSLPSGNLRVCAMVLQEYVFHSSFVRWALFPFSLQTDVDVASLFYRDLMRYVHARYTYAGDSGGVLLIARLASRLFHLYESNQLPRADLPVLAALHRSGPQWPPIYPPFVLSKLMPGHEQFAPAQILISEDDGLREITPDVPRTFEVLTKWQEVHKRGAFIKKEYSEASRGVVRAGLESELALRASLEKVWTRGPGTSQMDMDTKVRIVVQREILTGSHRPVGLRFFADRGVMVAGHSSSVEHGTAEFGVSYITTRHARVERETSLLVKYLNYTGFGTAWWWTDGSTGVPYLIDFNPRLERHACLASILPDNLKHLDACAVFQHLAVGRKLTEWPYHSLALPIVIPAGFRYMEPTRAMDANTRFFLELMLNPLVAWNSWREDTKAMDAMQWRLKQVRPAIEAFKEYEEYQRREREKATREMEIVHASVQTRERVQKTLQMLQAAEVLCNEMAAASMSPVQCRSTTHKTLLDKFYPLPNASSFATAATGSASPVYASSVPSYRTVSAQSMRANAAMALWQSIEDGAAVKRR